MRSALVVDDDEWVRNCVAETLRRLGVSGVEAAADGADARRQLQRMGHVDLIVSDLIMPGADGLELLRDAARSQPRAALIILSAAEPDVLRTAAVVARERGLRVLGALRKPLRPEALAELLRASAAEGAASMVPPAPKGSLQALLSGRTGLVLQPRLRIDDGSLHSVELLVPARNAPPEPVAAVLAAVNDASQRAQLVQHFISQGLRLRCDCSRLPAAVPVAMSLGALALTEFDLPALLDQITRSAGISASLLMIEIADGAQADSAARLEDLARLRMRGVRVALEQFGAGSMSLLRLQRMPLTDLKLDRRLVEGFSGNRAQRAVVEHALKLSRALSLEAVACGVDTAELMEELRGLSYSVLQGMAVAAPMTAADLDAWVPSEPVPSAAPVAPAAQAAA